MKQPTSRTFISIILCVLTLFCQAQIWEAVNPPLNLFNSTIYATTVDASGNIYAGGAFENSGRSNFVAKWNGSDWVELGSGTTSLNANGLILALAHHEDTIYAAGAFTNKSAHYYVAKWNGNSWEELNSNSFKADGVIYSLAVDKSGNVYAAGNFADSTGSYYVAKWNGTNWSQLGALKANRTIHAVAVDAAGRVYAGGYFTNAAGKQYVAQWDGTSWRELGTGTNALNANDYIRSLATDDKGNVYAAGAFRNGSGEYYLAKWNGSNWTELGAGTGALQANSTINNVVVRNESEIYASGHFTNKIGSYYVAQWNGTAWLPVSDLQQSWYLRKPIESIAVDAAGNLYAGGQFLNKSGHSFIAKKDNSEWQELGAKGDPFYSSQPIYQLVGDSMGNLYVSGNFQNNGGWFYLQHWNGKTWQELSIPYPSDFSLSIGGPRSMELDKKGKLYVPGRKITENEKYDCILTWDGTQWSVLEDFPNSLGSYNNNPANGIRQIEADAQGNIYVSGNFSNIAYGNYSLAKWDGTTWKRLPGSMTDYIDEFCVAGDGIIYAYGSFTNEMGRAIIASYNPASQTRWMEVKNGSSRLGVPGLNIFSALATDDKNHLYVNGYFTNTAGNRYVAHWDGKSWNELGPTSSLGLGLVIDQNNQIYTNKEASAYSDPILKWDGSKWRGVGTPLPVSGLNFTASLLAVDATGNVYSDARSMEPGIGSYIVRYGTSTVPPELYSFSPTSGSTGTTITITGKHLSGTASVSFGGTNATSYTVKNDSTLTAVVANGSSGNVVVKTRAGEASLQRFTFTCDSVTGPIPTISLRNDSTLVSSPANHYQWYLNNRKLPDAITNSIVIKNAGFYHVETSADKTCWLPSTDYPVIISRSATEDSLQLLVYPNPSPGNFTTYVKLPQVTSVVAYVQVFDANGILAHQTQKLIFYGNEIRIPVTLNTKGTYFVKVTINDKTIQQTLIIL